MVQGNVGPYKIAYLKPDQKDILYSKMFDRIEAALDYAHSIKGRWLLFKKVGHEGDDYAWKMLPYGAYRSVRAGIVIDKWKIMIIIGLSVLAFYLFKKITSGTGKTLY